MSYIHSAIHTDGCSFNWDMTKVATFENAINAYNTPLFNTYALCCTTQRMSNTGLQGKTQRNQLPRLRHQLHRLASTKLKSCICNHELLCQSRGSQFGNRKSEKCPLHRGSVHTSMHRGREPCPVILPLTRCYRRLAVTTWKHNHSSD